jgi:hypothetical protein
MLIPDTYHIDRTCLIRLILRFVHSTVSYFPFPFPLCFAPVLKRPSSTPATEVEDFSNGFPINPDYKEVFDKIVHRWRVTPLRAYDANGTFIKISEQELVLPGSLVLVYFQLKHYAFKKKMSDGVGSNTFTATATQVKVLERPTVRQASPYRSLVMKGPTFLPQSPSKKMDQARAVQAFHPGTMIPPV